MGEITSALYLGFAITKELETFPYFKYLCGQCNTAPGYVLPASYRLSWSGLDSIKCYTQAQIYLCIQTYH